MTSSVRRLIRTTLLAAAAAGLAVLLPAAGEAGAQPPKGKLTNGQAFKSRVALEGVNEAPGWAVRVTVDREDRTYQIGDTLTAEVVSEQPGFLYLFNIDATGAIDLIYPNAQQKENRIEANTPVRVPSGQGAGFVLRITAENAGVEYIKAVVAKEPLSELADAVKNARSSGRPIEIKPQQYERALREAALRGYRDKAPTTGSLTRDVDAWKRGMLKSGKIAVEKVEKQTASWAEHQVEIHTGGKDRIKPPPPGQGRRVALLVGISKYSSGAIRQLGCAHKDASDLAAALRGKFEVNLLTDSQATMANVRSAFAQVVATTRPGDSVLIYWAGHGGRCANTDGTEPDGFDEYLVPHDGSLASDEDIKATMLTDKAFGRWVQELDGRRVLVVLDTCHSGGQIEGIKTPRNVGRATDGSPKFTRGVNTPGLNIKKTPTEPHMLSNELRRYGRLRTRDIRRSDAAVLCAASAKEFAFEMTDGTNGVMTHFLLEYLRSNAGGVTLRGAYEFVGPKVSAYAQQNFSSPQTPVFSDETPWAPVALTQ